MPRPRRAPPARRSLAAGLALAAGLSACSSSADDDGSTVSRGTVAFVMVGPRDDLGYNQAVWEGSLEIERRFPDLEVIRVENVPETEEAERVMRQLVEDGADLVFATSFGHLPHAFEVADDHPEVVVVHQGGTEPEPGLPNFGTYFGSHWEAMYEAGIAAGHATTAGNLGFIAAFPIPATFANVNAFTLGARRVVTDAVVRLRFTEDWCDPDAQEQLVRDLVEEDEIDGLALHQDCTTRILELAEAEGVAVVGYHADGSEVASTRWLVGAVWTWGDLYADIVDTVLDGDFPTSPYNLDFRGSIGDGNNPFTLTEPGPAVGEAARAEIERARRELQEGLTPFRGPLVDRDGTLRVPDGDALTVAEVDRLDWWVEGVEGELPAS